MQAVGRGDAFYPSNILPPSELLSESVDFNPFGYFIELAHKEGLEVHVWINLLYMWSSDHMPVAPNHVIRQHPEWLVVEHSDLSSDIISQNEYIGKRDQDLFLSPALPEVRVFLTEMIGEILEDYPVDGVHLDYIRYPSWDTDFGSFTRKTFSNLYRVDPLDIFVRSPSSVLPELQSSTGDLRNEWYRWRAQQVTDLLKEIRKVQEEKSPEVTLSAAVIPDIARAYRTYGQDWITWLNEGIIDLVVTMSYSPSRKTVLSQAREAKQAVRSGRLFIGLALYNQSLRNALETVEELRKLGVDGFSFFSYNTMLEHPESFSSVRRVLSTEASSAPLSQ